MITFFEHLRKSGIEYLQQSIANRIQFIAENTADDITDEMQKLKQFIRNHIELNKTVKDDDYIKKLISISEALDNWMNYFKNPSSEMIEIPNDNFNKKYQILYNYVSKIISNETASKLENAYRQFRSGKYDAKTLIELFHKIFQQIGIEYFRKNEDNDGAENLVALIQNFAKEINQDFKIYAPRTRMQKDISSMSFRPGGKTQVSKVNSFFIKSPFRVDKSLVDYEDVEDVI